MHAELAAHEQHPQYGLAQYGNPYHGGQTEQHHHAHPPVHGAGEIGRIRIHMFPGQRRQDHSADGDREQTEGELQQAIRVIEIADGAGRQEGGQHGVDQQIDLADRDAEQRRYHQGADLHHTRMVPTPLGPHQHVDLAQEGVLEQKLHQAAEEDADRQRDLGPLQQRGYPPGRRNHGEVEKHRREGGDGEATEGVENGPGHGGEGDEPEIGESNLEHQAGQLELLGRRPAVQPVPEPAPAKDGGQHTRAQHPEQGDYGDDSPKGARHRRQQLAHGLLVTVFLVLRHHRHEGLVEGPFGEQPAQEVGNAVGEEEDVCGHPGTEQIGDDHIAHQAHHAGRQRHSGHYHAGFDQFLTQDEASGTVRKKRMLLESADSLTVSHLTHHRGAVFICTNHLTICGWEGIFPGLFNTLAKTVLGVLPWLTSNLLRSVLFSQRNVVSTTPAVVP
ncbi:hypothetical protein D3C76_765640 [compost metagenome]